MLNEFKTFAMRGNVVDMAVGIIIGAAFGAIVSGFVDQIMMPLLGLITGGTDFSNMFVLLREGTTPGPYASLEAAKTAEEQDRLQNDIDQWKNLLLDASVGRGTAH